MGAAREATQADFDLERFIEIFDEAMTSKDPRVIETLRSLMMIVTLTRPEVRDPQGHRGPLRQLFDDMHNLNRRLGRIEEDMHSVHRKLSEAYSWDDPKYPYEKYTLQASAQMAQQIDQDLLARLKSQSVAKIKGLK